MKIIIKNIGTISEATIELNSLTVIAGENNSGKTTISKIVYAIGQASSSFPVDYKRHQYNECRRLYDELTMIIHRFGKNSMILNKDGEFDVILAILSDIRRSPEVNEYDYFLVKELIGKIDFILDDSENKSKLLERLELILVKLEEFYYNYNHNDPIDKFIYRALKNEFSDEILNKKNNATEAFLALYEDENLLFEITFNDKNIISFSSHCNSLPIKDSTLIEGPYIFQLAPIIHDMTFRESLSRKNTKINSRVPYHILDLCSKLDGSKNIEDSECVFSPLWSLKEFYDGNIEFKRDIGSFELIQGNLNFNVNNVSSGVKSIAILDLLCRGDFINRDSILIIDEPETNLHPKWQKIYAKVLVDLASSGTNILVNTHSPYMLEALKIYNDKAVKLSNNKFYFSRKKDNVIIFNDTEGNIVPIIDALSAPLYDLMTELEDVDNF
ncbi:AAA family ATPase [Acinetobacter baumannii]|nr:AAA family ATPase [Acinetobacter baumannii]